jgi:hypothetical protein
MVFMWEKRLLLIGNFVYYTPIDTRDGVMKYLVFLHVDLLC